MRSSRARRLAHQAAIRCCQPGWPQRIEAAYRQKSAWRGSLCAEPRSQPGSTIQELISPTQSPDARSRRAFFSRLCDLVDIGGQAVTALGRLHRAAKLPTLIVWGARDPFIPVSHAVAAHDAIPGSRLEIFDGVGRYPHCEAPERFVEVLADFIASTEPARLSAAFVRARHEGASRRRRRVRAGLDLLRAPGPRAAQLHRRDPRSAASQLLVSPHFEGATRRVPFPVLRISWVSTRPSRAELCECVSLGLMWIFVCDRDGRCRPGPRENSSAPRINVERLGRAPEVASRAAAKEFFASNLRYQQVETTVDEDLISA
jgi:hypothetical protein